MTVTRRKRLLAQDSMDILKLMVHFGEGVMTQQHIMEYMTKLSKRTESQLRLELGELVEEDIIRRYRIQRVVCYRVSKFAKSLVLNIPVRGLSILGDTKEAIIRSMTFNEYVLKFLPIGWEKHTVDSLYNILSRRMSLFHRRREGYKILQSYLAVNILESHPLFEQEFAYLEDKHASALRKPSKGLERPPLLSKMVTFHGLQQMNFHLNVPLKIDGLGYLEVLFFEFDRSYDGREFTDRIKKVSDYLFYIVKRKNEETRLVFQVFCKNEERKIYYEKHFKPLEEEYKRNQILIKFKVLDIDERFFAGERVLSR